MQKEASYYLKLPHDYTECYLCPHNCTIMPSRIGLCGVRRNNNGTLILTVYGHLALTEVKAATALPLSPEYANKKFLFVGSIGCNMKCPFCLTWRSSQVGVLTRVYTPEQLVQLALTEKVNGIAFTHNEPAIGLEYLLAVARLARREKLLLAVATNAFLNKQPFADLLAHIDIMVVDLKSWDAEFLRVECGGIKEVILNNISVALPRVHLEVSYLVIEGLNDKDADLVELARWLGNHSSEIPLHLVRFQPAFRYTKYKKTGHVRLYQLQKLLCHHLKYVYVVE